MVGLVIPLLFGSASPNIDLPQLIAIINNLVEHPCLIGVLG